VTLKDVPADIQDALQYYGHVAIHTGRVDYRKQGDGALSSSRYTGVLRRKELSDDTMVIGGPGMAMWLGDEDQKGQIIESLLTITAQTFENTIRALLPTHIHEGTLFNIGGSPFTGTFQFMSPREAIDYVTQTMGAEWRVNGNGTIDAGLVSDLYRVDPKTIIDRRLSGVDMDLRGFLGNAKTDQDVEDFTTRVLLLASGVEGSVVTATADIAGGLNPYKDVFGNAIKMSRIVSESATDPTNAPARAQLQLNRFSDTRDAMTLDTEDYDIKGDLVVGDYMWVHDPKIDLVDGANEKKFRGKKINPMKLRLTEMTFPIKSRYSVGFRTSAGVWHNLTDYFQPETGSTTLIVGGYSRSLTGGGADGGAGGSRPLPNTTIPGAPTWVTPFTQGVYQSPLTGETKAQVQLKWLRPNNTDTSTITDGDHYEIRYRSSTTPIFPVTWSQMAGTTWGAAKAAGATWGHPLQYVAGPWNMVVVGFDQLSVLLTELSPNMPYEAQVRAVDGAVPSNYGAWSANTVFQTSGDTIAPRTPAPPSIAASRIAVQVTHYLGVASGGTFNLDADVHHLNVYGEYEPTFVPGPTNLLGKIYANMGMIKSHTPAVGTINLESVNPVYFKVTAVDNDGNESNASAAVQATALLIDNAHISDLTVSKVTAGTISSNWLIGAEIATAPAGVGVSRWFANAAGMFLVNAAGVTTLSASAVTGNLDTIGELSSAPVGSAKRVVVNQRIGGSTVPEIRMYPTSGSTFGYINSIPGPLGASAGVGVNSSTMFGAEQSTMYCHPEFVAIGRMTLNGPNPFRGGYSDYHDDRATMGVYFPAGVDAFVEVRSDYRIRFKGVMENNNGGIGGLTAAFGMFIDSDAFSLIYMGFAATMAGNPCVVGSWAEFANVYRPDVSAILHNFTNGGVTIGTARATGVPATLGRYSIWVWQVL
jgi:hypothetical protein